MPDKRCRIVLGLLTMAALVLLYYPAFDHLATGMEEGALLVYPELIQKGAVPYRDFETFYGPANLGLLAGVYTLTGPGIFAERAVGLFYRVAIFSALFLLLQKRGPFLACGAALLAGVALLPTGLAAFAWIGALMCALWSLYFLSAENSKASCALAGMCAGLALLFRPDFAPAVVLAALPLFLRKELAGRIRYGLGAGVALVPYALLAIVAGPKNLFDNIFLYPVVYSSPARHLPILTAQPDVLALFLLHLVAVAIGIGAASVALWRERTNLPAQILLSFSLLALGLSHQAAQRLDYGHLVSALSVSLPVLCVCLWLAARRGLAISADFWPAAIGSVAVICLFFFCAPRMRNIALHDLGEGFNSEKYGGAAFLEHEGRIYPVRSKAGALDTAKLLRHLKDEAKPNDRLFVGPSDLSRTNYNDTYLYYLARECRPATYFLEMNPGSANRPNSRLAADVASADWLVLTHEADDWREPNESAKAGSDAPVRVVQRDFELVAQYGVFDLYRHHALVAASR